MTLAIAILVRWLLVALILTVVVTAIAYELYDTLRRRVKRRRRLEARTDELMRRGFTALRRDHATLLRCESDWRMKRAGYNNENEG